MTRIENAFHKKNPSPSIYIIDLHEQSVYMRRKSKLLYPIIPLGPVGPQGQLVHNLYNLNVRKQRLSHIYTYREIER
jgi:hypothetical protein